MVTTGGRGFIPSEAKMTLGFPQAKRDWDIIREVGWGRGGRKGYVTQKEQG